MVDSPGPNLGTCEIKKNEVASQSEEQWLQHHVGEFFISKNKKMTEFNFLSKFTLILHGFFLAQRLNEIWNNSTWYYNGESSKENEAANKVNMFIIPIAYDGKMKMRNN